MRKAFFQVKPIKIRNLKGLGCTAYFSAVTSPYLFQRPTGTMLISTLVLEVFFVPLEQPPILPSMSIFKHTSIIIPISSRGRTRENSTQYQVFLHDCVISQKLSRSTTERDLIVSWNHVHLLRKHHNTCICSPPSTSRPMGELRSLHSSVGKHFATATVIWLATELALGKWIASYKLGHCSVIDSFDLLYLIYKIRFTINNAIK